MRALLTASVLSALMLTGAAAAEQPKAKATNRCLVAVESGGDDAIGSRLALAVKERLKASSLFTLVDVYAPEGWHDFVELVSLDVDVPPRGIRSAVAVRLAVPPGSGGPCQAHQLLALIVGASQVASQADLVVADLERFASEQHAKCPAP
jgi:hypothetical protein